MALFIHPVPTLATIGAALSVCYLLYRAALPRPIPGIPCHQASARSVLGDIPAMLKHTQTTSQVFDWMVAQCVVLNSPIVQIFARPLGRPFVILADFREGQDILMRRMKEFDRSNFMGDLFLGLLPDHHISMPSNETFRKQRRLLSDTMSPAFLQDVVAPQIYATVLDLLELWRVKSVLADGHPWSVPRDVYHTALDAIWAATFGTHPGATKSQLELLSATDQIDRPSSRDIPVEFPQASVPPAFEAIITLTDSLEAIVSSPLPRLHHWVLRQLPYMRSAKRHKDHYIVESLDQAREKFSESSEKDESVNSAMEHMLRRELAAAKKEGRTPEYDTPAVKDELFGFLIAGHETTSTTVTWGMKLLTDHQQVQQKLRQALRAAFSEPAASGANPSAAEIARAQIPYLDATLEEILRCAQTASGVMRVAKCDTQVLGYHIPRGTDVFCMANGPSIKSAPLTIDENLRSASCRDAKDRTGMWDIADISLFMPERWLAQTENGEATFDPRAGPNLPFGLGPRGCFGRKLAEMELRILIVLLIWNFDFQPTPPALSSYRAVDKITHQPQQCFVRLAPAK